MTHSTNYRPDWFEIKRLCERDREKLVKDLVDGSINDDHIRGQITAIDRILGLEKEPPKRPQEKPVSYV